MVGVTMDITELKQAHEQVRLAKEQAEAANAAKDQFLAVLSHELRTPLTPVLASVEMLGRLEKLPEEVASSLDTIRRNVQMEARIIADLLDLTRIRPRASRWFGTRPDP
jgi:signal transduction histidine kinase